ncbi:MULTISPECIES: AAA family ATPase [Sphingomonas]|uniref:AAA family ATPase n=1 Tax=Sphingomonas TaxID=13687 RepID=UPI001042D2C6|nr:MULTISPECIES: AAA family ATPase [Sphingomonas]TCQ07330.1 exopolysaccharide/PEP-CTERM locus tyrosine autokinase [Sphingomonas sp. PP-CC-3A-396]
MTVTKPDREPSLLERAAKVYDFNAHARARNIGADAPITPEPAEVPAAVAPVVEPAAPVVKPDVAARPLDVTESTFLAIPEALRAPVGDEFADDVYYPEEPDDTARIDRGMLAANGMIVPGAPVGPLAEEFRLIKRQLLIASARIAESDSPDKARMILVCSARPEDGKTFCAINLALSIAAERDTEVLLVDADVAKPDIVNQLGLADSPGLLDALGDARIDVEDLVIHTDVPHLAILPAGTKTAMDTELLASARTRAVITRLLAANPRRIIIIDSPPALAASAASVLAMRVGQVMLVVRADRTPESELRAAVNILDGCEHIQLVLNAVSFVQGGARFGSYYGQDNVQ